MLNVYMLGENFLVDKIPKAKEGQFGVNESERKKQQKRFFDSLYRAYSIVIDAYAVAGEPRFAVEWFRRLQQARVNPTISIYNSLIEAFVRRGDVSEGVRWFSILEKERKVAADVMTYSLMLRLFGDKRDIVGVNETLEKMVKQKVEPNEGTLKIVMASLPDVKDLDAAQHVFDSLNEKLFEASKPQVAAAVVQVQKGSIVREAFVSESAVKEDGLLQRCREAIKSGKLKLVQGCWREARSLDAMLASHNVYSNMIQIFSKYGDSRHAVQVFDFLEKNNWKFIIQKYNDVLDAFVNSSDHAGAELFFQRIIDSGLTLNYYTYNCMINVHAKSGNVDQ
eukprot:gene607-473_t